jgi:hypothetical protein
VITGGGKNWPRVFPIWLVELVVIVLNFTETVDDIAEQQVELRNLAVSCLIEIGEHLIDDEVLCFRTSRATAVARGVEDNLIVLLDIGDRRCVIP